jgi:hypothetical protein
MVSIAAMLSTPNKLRSIVIVLVLAGTSLGVLGCGGDNGPDPSIPADSARTLEAKIQEIQDNVAVGSCVVAADKTDDLLAEVDQLPSSVNGDVKRALENGTNNLKLLLNNPDQCQGRTTTTEPTTTEESTTEPTTTEKNRPETTTTQTQTQPNTTTTQTQTQPTTTTGGSGGIGPGGL